MDWTDATETRATTSMARTADLVAMMARACPHPKDVVRSADADGAAAVALALHCASRLADARRRRATVGFGTELLSSDEGRNNSRRIVAGTFGLSSVRRADRDSRFALVACRFFRGGRLSGERRSVGLAMDVEKELCTAIGME